MKMNIKIVELSTGFMRAQGDGPCEWAQWPKQDHVRDEHFFPESSELFRRALKSKINTGR